MKIGPGSYNPQITQSAIRENIAPFNSMKEKWKPEPVHETPGPASYAAEKGKHATSMDFKMTNSFSTKIARFGSSSYKSPNDK